MKTKIILIIGSFLISTIHATQVQAVMHSPSNTVSNPVSQSHENRLSGVVSKLSDGKIEINAVTYEFSPNHAEIYDLNGRINKKMEIKVGMFVNFIVVDGKNKARITEIRLVRK